MKKIGIVFITLALMISFVCLSPCISAKAKYKCANFKGKVKIGKTVFKAVGDWDSCKIVMTKNGIKRVLITNVRSKEYITNGRIIYCTGNRSTNQLGGFKLYKYNIKTGSLKCVMKVGKKYSIGILGKKGNRLYYTRYKYEATGAYYLFNLKNHKKKRIKKFLYPEPTFKIKGNRIVIYENTAEAGVTLHKYIYHLSGKKIGKFFYKYVPAY